MIEHNSKQKKMGVDAAMRSVDFSDLLNDLCTIHGQGKLADQIGMDPAQFSRFKSGDGNISLKHLEALLSFSDCMILPSGDVKRLMLSFYTVSELWRKTMGW